MIVSHRSRPYLISLSYLASQPLQWLGRFLWRCLWIGSVKPCIPLHPVPFWRWRIPPMSRSRVNHPSPDSVPPQFAGSRDRSSGSRGPSLSNTRSIIRFINIENIYSLAPRVSASLLIKSTIFLRVVLLSWSRLSRKLLPAHKPVQTDSFRIEMPNSY